MMIDASSPAVTRDKQGNRIAADDSYPQMPGERWFWCLKNAVIPMTY